jgi:hypothetical protein
MTDMQSVVISLLGGENTLSPMISEATDQFAALKEEMGLTGGAAGAMGDETTSAGEKASESTMPKLKPTRQGKKLVI